MTGCAAALKNNIDKTYYSSATSAAQIQVGDPRSLVVTVATASDLLTAPTLRGACPRRGRASAFDQCHTAISACISSLISHPGGIARQADVVVGRPDLMLPWCFNHFATMSDW
jgi:hypothetical protein